MKYTIFVKILAFKYKFQKIVCNYYLTYEEIEKETKEPGGKKGGRKQEKGRKEATERKRERERRWGEEEGGRVRQREKEKFLVRAGLSRILFRNPVLFDLFVHLQRSVIEQYNGSKLLQNAKNPC